MPRKLLPNTQCDYRSQLNRRCKMLRAPDHPALCTHHARAAAQSLQRADRQRAGVELLAGADSFSTPASVNLFLGNLLKQTALGRIPRRQATSLAYISQLLLNSISVAHRHEKDAQAAAAQADAQEPPQVLVNIPRPRYRPHLDDDPSTGIRSGGSSDPCLSPDPHRSASQTSLSPKRTLQPVSAAPHAAPQHTNAAHPPIMPSPTTPGAADAPTAPTTPPPITSPGTSAPTPTPPRNPLAGQPLLHPEEPDPSNHPARFPARQGTRVYGIAALPRRRNWPANTHRLSSTSVRLLTSGTGQIRAGTSLWR